MKLGFATTLSSIVTTEPTSCCTNDKLVAQSNRHKTHTNGPHIVLLSITETQTTTQQRNNGCTGTHGHYRKNKHIQEECVSTDMNRNQLYALIHTRARALTNKDTVQQDQTRPDHHHTTPNDALVYSRHVTKSHHIPNQHTTTNISLQKSNHTTQSYIHRHDRLTRQPPSIAIVPLVQVIIAGKDRVVRVVGVV